MTQSLHEDHSPLAQAQRPHALAVKGSERALSHEDQATLKEILENPYECMHDAMFEEPDAERRIFEDAPEIPEVQTSWYHTVVDGESGSRQDGIVRLTQKQERALFLQFNYCRYQVVQLKERAGDGEEPVDPEDAKAILFWHHRAEAHRERIANLNLGLVLAMAKRSRVTEVDFSEMVSEGNMALLRSIDKFDASRGFKFSTYACRAIVKALHRLGERTSRQRLLFPASFDPALEKSDYTQRKRESHREDCVDELRQIVRNNQAELSGIEQQIVEHRFALGHERGEDPSAEPLTLEQVGKLVGVTKERVRQIQNQAIRKIRQQLEQRVL